MHTGARSISSTSERIVKAQMKRNAALAAVDTVQDGMLLGLGSGSTSAIAIEEIGKRYAAGKLKVRAICTSHASEEIARRYKIPIMEPGDFKRLDLYIDGADEIDPAGRMIKGGGGALTRERIVASYADFKAIIVDREKLVNKLGETFALPIEILPFFHLRTEETIAEAFGCEPLLRRDESGIYTTDNGNYILDCHFPQAISDPDALYPALNTVPGVVDNGLFLKYCDELIIGTPDGTESRQFSQKVEARS